MNRIVLNVIYYIALTILLIFTGNEFLKEGKKFIAFLSFFVAGITIIHAINNLKKPDYI